MSLLASMNQLVGSTPAAAGERTIAILCTGKKEAALREVTGVYGGHWPEPTHPRLAVFGIADAVGRKDVLDTLRTCDCAVVIAADNESPAELRSVAALLNEHDLPVVVCLPASLAHLTSQIQTVGAMVHLQGRGDAALAALVAGLSSRQASVREIEI
jgi:hypothetical protein